MGSMTEAWVLSAVRTPVGKAPRGTLRRTRPDELGALVLRAAVERVSGLTPESLDDVILGCAMPEGVQGMNVARLAAIRAGFPVSVPALTVNRFCASGAESVARGAAQIRSGLAHCVVAGGAESMSLVPAAGHGFAPNPTLIEEYPDVYLGMGLTAENLAQRYGIGRELQDAWALRSHQRAVAALREGRFREECVPVPVTDVDLDTRGSRIERTCLFETDEGPRSDTSAAALGKLRPVFHARGTVTAGNSSQTSDGAAAVVLASDEAVSRLGCAPIGRFVSWAVAGVPPEVMGIGPVPAIPAALKQAGLTLDDIDVIELNEAFAVQALAVIQESGLDPERVNVNGGAIALGHPLGATGCKLLCSLLNELARRGGRYGMVTMCVGGGMGGALIVENLRR